MRVRPAGNGDAHALTRVYLACSRNLGESFVVRLGERFLDQYHALLLREKSSLALLAEDEQGRVIGNTYGSLDAAEHMDSLRRHKLSLLLASMGAIIRNPKLLLELVRRNRSAAERNDDYVVTSGARIEFWGWDPSRRDGAGALVLLQAFLAEARARGARQIRSEVDEEHEKILRIHKSLGGKVERSYVTPDGRARRVVVYESK